MLLNSEKVPRPSGLYIYIYIERERERVRERERRLAKIPVGVELVLEFWGERVDTTKILV